MMPTSGQPSDHGARLRADEPMAAPSWPTAAEFDAAGLFRYAALDLARNGVTAANLARLQYVGAEFTGLCRRDYRAVLERAARWSTDLLADGETDG
jgi:hypothetical protein